VPMERRHERLMRLRALVRALGPESAFQRGFSITLGADGKVVRSVAGLRPGDLLRTKLIDGETTSKVVG
jgi:exodeoxyribonuclease VII large subunit